MGRSDMVRMAIRLALVLAVAGPFAACGMFDDEEPLSGERIRIRDQIGRMDAGPTGQGDPIPEAILNESWTQTNGRASHASGHLAGPAAPTLAWNASVGSGGGSGARITGAPVVSGTRIFTLDAESRLAAFDAGTGAPAWRTSLAPAGESGSFGGGIATDGRFVYAT